MATLSSFLQLREYINSLPVIDNHAHNLIVSNGDDEELEAIVSEASGPALHHAASSLAHLQAVQQLARLYACEPTWDSIKRYRIAAGFDRYTDQCFQAARIQCILMDDLFASQAKVAIPFDWHDKLTVTATRRIVRVETLAEEIAQGMEVADLRHFVQSFLKRLVDEARDPVVVGFKSVICYRTGLDIDVTIKERLDSKTEPFVAYFTAAKTSGNWRLASKALNDMVANLACQVSGQYGKPIQFHTGLGDNDIRLAKANPTGMQRLIEAYPKTKFVILHSAYPFTREAGYLTTVYDNVYFDFGEAIPMLSPAGQRSMVKQVMELSPTDKILFSTDGHWYPETYYLGVLQAREVLTEILDECVSRGEMTLSDAKDISRKALFSNSNTLYNLKLKLRLSEPETKVDALTERTIADFFTQKGIDLVRIQWVDYCNMIRCRVFPVKQFMSFITSPIRKSVGITKAVLGMIQVDLMAPGFSPASEYFLMPDLKSLRTSTLEPRYAYLMGQFEEKFGETKEVGVCPRTILNRVVKEAQGDYNVTFLAGFETEVVFLEDSFPPTPISNHAWSTSLSLRTNSIGKSIVEEIHDVLSAAGVEVQQFHGESAPGQYEIITGPLPPVEAVDALVFTRDTIYNVAAKYGVRATLYPKVFAEACLPPWALPHSSGWIDGGSPSADLEDVPGLSVLETQFIAGVLEHLQAVAAFVMPTMSSYERLVDGAWAGGTHICWGIENREAPVRACPYGNGREYNFEIKCIDGTANPYLAVAAILAAGMIGVKDSYPLAMKPCQGKMSEEARHKAGITKTLPRSVQEALVNLDTDSKLVKELGQDFVKNYISVKEFEAKYIGDWDGEERKKWMIERI